jgi:hypothetical protein
MSWCICICGMSACARRCARTAEHEHRDARARALAPYLQLVLAVLSLAVAPAPAGQQWLTVAAREPSSQRGAPTVRPHAREKVWRLALVNLHVRPELAALDEALLARGALEGLLARVNTPVLQRCVSTHTGEHATAAIAHLVARRHLRETLATDVALVRLQVAVDVHVDVEQVLRRERGSAQTALERPSAVRLPVLNARLMAAEAALHRG